MKEQEIFVMTEEEKMKLIEEYKMELKRDKYASFFYIPQRDITTFELAQLTPLFEISTKTLAKMLERLDASCFRHMKPSWKNKKEEKKENKSFWRRIFS